MEVPSNLNVQSLEEIVDQDALSSVVLSSLHTIERQIAQEKFNRITQKRYFKLL